MKNIIRTPINQLRTPVFSFKQIQGTELHKINILFTSNRYLGDDLKSQQLIPIGYGLEFRDPARIAKLFSHHEDKGK